MFDRSNRSELNTVLSNSNKCKSAERLIAKTSYSFAANSIINVFENDERPVRQQKKDVWLLWGKKHGDRAVE